MTRRLWIILIFIPLYTLVVCCLATLILTALSIQHWDSTFPSEFSTQVKNLFYDNEELAGMALFSSVMVATQIVFVVPLLAKHPPKGEQHKSLKLSLVMAGGIASMLSVGLLLGLISLYEVLLEESLGDIPEWVYAFPWIFMIGIWIGWSLLLFAFVHDIWADKALGRLIGLLIGGSILETLIILPIDIMVRRKTDCYCFAGSFFAMIISTWSLLWLAGPGIVIALTSKKHRLWRETHCGKCGYAKGPTPGQNCPECGYEWGTSKHVKNKLPDQS